MNRYMECDSKATKSIKTCELGKKLDLNSAQCLPEAAVQWIVRIGPRLGRLTIMLTGYMLVLEDMDIMRSIIMTITTTEILTVNIIDIMLLRLNKLLTTFSPLLSQAATIPDLCLHHYLPLHQQNQDHLHYQ